MRLRQRMRDNISFGNDSRIQVGCAHSGKASCRRCETRNPRAPTSLDSSADKLDLYLAHRSALVDYAAPIVGCRARAEDVVQEAWLRFNGRQDSGLAINNPVGYLYRIVRNLALDLTRSIATERRQPDGDSLLAQMPAGSASPEQDAVSCDELQQIADALAQLPERTRMAFEMHRLGGYTLQQIAAALGISVGLTHQLVHDALSHCAAWLVRGHD